uniref:Zmp:0000000760 n=1 Tax=Gasterosteus aculeatus aculeatus TaxID=481459 RepID=A0AAQ4P5V7_GASAC
MLNGFDVKLSYVFLLRGFDLLKDFHVPDSRGVRIVNGSQPQTVAYRVNPSVHLRRTMSNVYPDGLPSDYSVIATFKVTKDAAKKSWDLWQVSDPGGQEQVGLRFQGDTRSLAFFYTGPRGSHMLRTFYGVEQLFDGEWHKLALSVKGSRVKLLIDCEEVSVESIDEPRPVLYRGYTSIVKRAAGDRSMSVDLQQMEVSCDPEQAYSEGCCELSSVCGGYAEIGLTAGRASCKCMHGQPGIQGAPGPKGHRGLPGKAGDQGRQGNWGIRGNTGDYGNIGESGQKGEEGIKGEKGTRGLWGFVFRSELVKLGDPWTKGPRWLHRAEGDSPLTQLSAVSHPQNPVTCFTITLLSTQGIVGDPGLPGRDGDPGIQAYQGPQGGSGKFGRIGTKGEKGTLGPAGEMGPQGRTGPRGYKGSAGKPGRPGFIGPPGPAGHVGVPGKPGSKVIDPHPLLLKNNIQEIFTRVKGPKGKVGEQGELGPQGGRGKRGPAGPPGRSGPVGIKGIRGEGGPDGFQGPAGPPGPTLPAQHVIEVCKKVILEQMSSFANSVKRTCAAVCPLYGDVPMGAPGPTGQKGAPGPAGDPGNDGVDGEVGLPGFYGEVGELGRKGETGDRGEKGDKGPRGHGLPGYFGDQGPKGQRGRPGRAFNGQPGKQGERGHLGRPGLRGHAGLRGPPGVCVTSGCAQLNSTSGTPQPATRRLRNRS